MSEQNLPRRERERRERAEQERKKNQRFGAILAGLVIILPLALLPMCSSSGTPVNNLRDSGVQISNSDYKALCKSSRGEWGHDADLSGYGYTDDDMSRILATIAEDPSCQPDR